MPAGYTSCAMEALLIIALLIGVIWVGSIFMKRINKP